MGKKDNDFVMTMLCRVVDPPRKEDEDSEAPCFVCPSDHNGEKMFGWRGKGI
jgi:hypothetical protein